MNMYVKILLRCHLKTGKEDGKMTCEIQRLINDEGKKKACTWQASQVLTLCKITQEFCDVQQTNLHPQFQANQLLLVPE